MKFRKCLKHALNMVINSRLRSWLTIVGIVIGVASVIAIMSFGDGMEADMNDRLGDLGVDSITVTPGASRAGDAMRGPPGSGSGSSSSSADQEPLTKRDVQVVKGIVGVDKVNTEISGKAEVYFQGESGDMTITGTDQKVWNDFNSQDLDSGRFFNPSDSNVVIIGYSLANDYFENEISINSVLTIEGKSFRVIGILEDGTRNSIYMPIDSAYDVIEDSERDEYDTIKMTVDDPDEIENLSYKIETKLMLSRHVTEKDVDFSVSNTAQTSNMRGEMLSTMTSFLTAIAAISLLVGAIGIANTMFTSVLEKTKQIGIMKAIGAKNNDILVIFVLHAALIGLLGGILGVLLGFLCSKLMATVMGVSTIVSVMSIVYSLGVSVAAGILAGLVPAYQASKLKPVDALRYE